MILSFKVSNNLSINDEQELSFIASNLKDDVSPIQKVGNPTKFRVLPAVLLYGSNASGKTNIIKSLSRMITEIKNSHLKRGPDAEIARRAFKLDIECEKKPTTFEIEFLFDGIRHSYGFSFNNKEYLSEWLYWFPQGQPSKLFERDKSDITYGRSLKGRNKTIADLTRANSLYLSAAAQNDHKQLGPIVAYLSSIKLKTQITVDATSFIDSEEISVDERTIIFLEKIDTGICTFEKKASKIDEKTKTLSLGFLKLMSESFEEFPSNFEDFPDSQNTIKLGHKSKKGEIIYFDLDVESAGTRRLLHILGPVFEALDTGSAIIIDEIDASLHTNACELMFAMFNDKNINKNGAQLIATTHDTNLLNSNTIRRDQVWFTQKSKIGATKLYPLTDIYTKKQDNIEKGYLQGRYGALPFDDLVLDDLRQAFV